MARSPDRYSYESLLSRAIAYVSFRPRSSRELTNYLISRSGSDPAIDTVSRVIARMVELGYVDDAAFARAYAHDQMVVRRRGAVLVKRQLAAKGIDAETISQVLKTLANDDTIPDEAERAKKAIGRRGIGWDLLPPPMRKRKMTEFLLRRGFSSSCIRTLVDDSSGSDYNTEDRNGEDG